MGAGGSLPKQGESRPASAASPLETLKSRKPDLFNNLETALRAVFREGDKISDEEATIFVAARLLHANSETSARQLQEQTIAAQQLRLAHRMLFESFEVTKMLSNALEKAKSCDSRESFEAATKESLQNLQRRLVDDMWSTKDIPETKKALYEAHVQKWSEDTKVSLEPALQLEMGRSAVSVIGPLRVEAVTVKSQVQELELALSKMRDMNVTILQRTQLEHEVLAAKRHQIDVAQRLHKAMDTLNAVKCNTTVDIVPGLVKDENSYLSALMDMDEAEAGELGALTAKAEELLNKSKLKLGAEVELVHGRDLIRGRVVELPAGEDGKYKVSLYHKIVHRDKRYDEGFDTSEPKFRMIERLKLYSKVKTNQTLSREAQELWKKRQQLCKPSANTTLTSARTNSADFLMLLFYDAEQTLPWLKQLADAVRSNGQFDGQVQSLVAPLKKTGRAIIKALEKYDGCFDQLTDLVRMTFKCTSLKAAKEMLAWLGDQSLEILRIKNRLMVEFDASESGGYRDMLLNVRCPDTRHICEIQITLDPLLKVKQGGGHAAYNLSRLFHLFEPATYVHHGALTATVIKNIDCGITRELHLAGRAHFAERFTELTMALRSPSCVLQVVHLMGLKWSQGKEIKELLLPLAQSANAAVLLEVTVYDMDVSGQIPAEFFEGCKRLKVLHLGSLCLTGSIPSTIGELQHSLEVLQLWSNALTGSIPAELGECKQLWQLQLGKNHLSGEVPPSFGEKFTKMTELTISNNRLTGAIPAGLCRMAKVQKLSLANNEFTGEVPSLEGCRSLAKIDFKGNAGLSGELRLPADCTLIKCDVTGTQIKEPSILYADQRTLHALLVTKRSLILGTFNIMSDDYNPFQFQPAIGDLHAAGMSQQQWDAAYEKVKASFQEYTLQHALDDLAAWPDMVARTHAFMSKAGLVASEALSAMASKKCIDLHLDNKTGPRFNPVVFANAKCKSRLANGQTHLQWAQADSTSYRQALLTYYDDIIFASSFDKVETELAPSDCSDDRFVSLMLFDLLCLFTVASDQVSTALLARASYMVDGATGERVKRDEQFRQLLKPLEALLHEAAHVEAADRQAADEMPGTEKVGKDPFVIIGCQEMPDIEQAVLESSLERLRSNLKTYRLPNKSDTVFSGFIYTGATFVRDATADVAKQAHALLAENLRVDAGVAKTTARKMCVCVFALALSETVKENVAVINVHCKNFKKQLKEQTQFLGGLRQIVFDALKDEISEVLIVGDLNIDSKWEKGTPPEQQWQTIFNAPTGDMPEALKNTGPLTIANGLAEQHLETYPKLEAITSLKLRTMLQGQPEKAGELTVAHKDCVIMPESGRFDVKKTVVAGVDNCESAKDEAVRNLALLQPSRLWPGDHFGILCVCKLRSDVE